MRATAMLARRTAPRPAASGGRGRRRPRGVTLIELMIVVVVVSILGTIAVASYRQNVLRAGRTEAQTALLTQQNNLERCYSRFGTFRPANADDCPTSRELVGPGLVSARGRYNVTGVIGPDAYTLTATARAGGGMVGDAACGAFGLDNRNVRTIGGTGTIAECWR